MKILYFILICTAIFVSVNCGCLNKNAYGYCTVLKHVLRVDAFTPKGLRLTIDDKPGLQVIEMRLNLNREIKSTDKGDLHFQFKKYNDGKWVYYNENAVLKLGDQLTFYLIIKENNEIIYYEKRMVTIKQILPSPYLPAPKPSTTNTGSRYPPPAPTCPPCICSSNSQANAQSSTVVNVYANQSTPQPPTNCPPVIAPQPGACSSGDILRMVNKLEKAHATIDSLSEVVEFLLDDTKVKGTHLFYKIGKPSDTQDADPKKEIQSVLIDYMDMIDLSNAITKAMYVDGGIAFEVKRPLDKMRVLLRGSKALALSPNKIVDPDAPPINIFEIFQTTTMETPNSGYTDQVDPSKSGSDIDEIYWRVDEVGITLPPKKNP